MENLFIACTLMPFVRVIMKRHGFTVYRWVKDPAQRNEAMQSMKTCIATLLSPDVRDFDREMWKSDHDVAALQPV